MYLDYNVSSGPFLSYEIEIGDGPGPELDNNRMESESYDDSALKSFLCLNLCKVHFCREFQKSTFKWTFCIVLSIILLLWYEIKRSYEDKEVLQVLSTYRVSQKKVGLRILNRFDSYRLKEHLDWSKLVKNMPLIWLGNIWFWCKNPIKIFRRPLNAHMAQ